MSLTTGGTTFLYVHESERGRILCALGERSYQGHPDLFTPYGFGGFVGDGDWEALRDEWPAFARDRGYVCGYIGLNPLLTDIALFDREELHEYNHLYVLDLTRSTEALFGSLSSNRKRQVHLLERGDAGLTLDSEACAEFLRENLLQFYADRGASEVYRFSDATIERLLDPAHSLLVGAVRDGTVEAVCHFVFTPYVAEYFAGVSLPQSRAYSSALIWAGAMELRRKGIPSLNLGGGVTRGDGIAIFKERFGGRVLPLASLKQVYEPDLYRALCESAGADPRDRSGFFPAYHRTGRSD